MESGVNKDEGKKLVEGMNIFLRVAGYESRGGDRKELEIIYRNRNKQNNL